MELELVHNPHRLSCFRTLRVQNPQQCEVAIRALMDSKRVRGMRLRHTYDIAKGVIELSARNTEPLRIAIRFLKSKGLYNGI